MTSDPIAALDQSLCALAAIVQLLEVSQDTHDMMLARLIQAAMRPADEALERLSAERPRRAAA